MLPEAGATELIFLAAIALIVVGPKDLPVLMRKVGQWVAKMRGLAAEFRSSFDELARQSELDELRKEVEALRNTRIPDPLNHPTFDEINTGLGTPESEPDLYRSDLSQVTDPHGQMTSVVETVPAAEPAPKPARTARRPRAAAADVDLDAAPKPPARPRARRTVKAKAGVTEPEG